MSVKQVHSALNILAGFETAVFIAWKLTVKRVISNAPVTDATNIHQEILV